MAKTIRLITSLQQNLPERKLPNIHNASYSNKQWAFLSPIESGQLHSKSKSGQADCCPSRYAKNYPTRDQNWRIADTKAPFDLHKLIDDFSGWYERIVEGGGYHFSSNIASHLPRYFHGNPLMLGFLLWDMGSYSRNFLDGEGVDLEVCSKPVGGNWHTISFSLMISASGSYLDKTSKLHLSGSRKCRTSEGHFRTNLYYARVIAGILNGRVSIHNDSGDGMECSAEFCLQNKTG